MIDLKDYSPMTDLVVTTSQYWGMRKDGKQKASFLMFFSLTDLLSNIQSIWTSVIHGWKGNKIRRFLVAGKQFCFHYVASTFS